MTLTLRRTGLTALATLGLLAFAGTRQAQAAPITQWTFENQPVTGAPPYNNSPTPSTGSGTAIALGMDNTYGTPGQSFNSSDIVADPGSSDPASQNAWRVRGQGTASSAANGWSTLAPQYTQGAEFDVSTLGFTGISVSFDFNPTNRGVEDLELQYNANTANASGWTNLGLYSNTVAGGVWDDVAPVSLGGIGAVNNDANFGIRIVSAYHPGTSTYYDTTGAPLNNNSGNVRYDNVTVLGTRSVAVPEPGPLALLTLGLLPLALLARRRHA